MRMVSPMPLASRWPSGTTLRIVPPLTISADEVDEAVARLRSALDQAAA